MELSTIVEIILAYQPWIYRVTVTPYLRQQKLYKLISLQVHTHLVYQCIYDSRNYISLLALILRILTGKSNLRQQKLYQLISPTARIQNGGNDLRQQKLYQLISQRRTLTKTKIIYDSRNYISLLATHSLHSGLSTSSTIVEIILAYQPPTAYQKFYMVIYDSRNYISLLASLEVVLHFTQSTIVEIILAYQPHLMYISQARKSTIVEIILAYQP